MLCRDSSSYGIGCTAENYALGKPEMEFDYDSDAAAAAGLAGLTALSVLLPAIVVICASTLTPSVAA